MLRFGLPVALAVLVADQLLKLLVLDWLAARSGGEPAALTGFLNIVLVRNQGASFGLFGGGGETASMVLLGVSLAVALALGVWLARTDRRPAALGLALVIGGALGNAVDRVRFGAVIDFLDLHAGGYHWPAFNLADAAITLGVILLLWESLFGDRESPK